MSDSSLPSARPVPLVYAVSGPLLALSAMLPLLPDGRSFLQLVIDLAREEGFATALMLGGYASPFLIGIAMTLAFAGAYHRRPGLQILGERAVRQCVALLHAQVLLTTGQLWWFGVGLAPGALFGVAVVTGSSLVYHSGRQASMLNVADDDDSRIYARWGALTLVATCAWMRLQIAADLRFGWALEVLLAGSVLCLWALQQNASKPVASNKDEAKDIDLDTDEP